MDTISVLLDRYGQCVTLYRGGVEPGREVRAFLQPLREAGREQARPSPLGLRREDRYLMLGEPDVPAAPGDRVVWRESGYEVRTAHPIYLGSGLSHWWAVLAPWGKGGDMSGGLEQIREGLTAHLNGKGIRAVSAWSGTARTFPCGPVAAVSLRGAAGARPVFKTIWGAI